MIAGETAHLSNFRAMDLVCFGQQNWDYCWTGKQQLMSRMAERGHRILYVDPTWIGTGSDGSPPPGTEGSSPGLRRVGPGDLHLLTYRYRPFLRWRGNLWNHPASVRRALDRLGFRKPLGLALRPGACRLMDRLEVRGRVYYAVDEMTAFGDRTDEEKRDIRAAEEAMLRSADLAVAVSPRLHDRFRTVHPRARLLPNGADVEHFSPAALAAARPHPALAEQPAAPTLAFVGQVDERLDQALLLAVADTLPDLRIVLAGRVKPGIDVSALAAHPRLHLLGYVDYADLPGVLRQADVCAVPYHVTELTRSCNPLKVFEYLATGLPVVSTRLDALTWCDDVVEIADGPVAFGRAVREALDHPQAGRAERVRRARENGWDARVDTLESWLHETERLRAPGGGVPAHTPDRRFNGDRMGAPGLVMLALTHTAGAALGAGRALRRAVVGEAVAPRRILVSRRCRLGDLVALLPTLRALRARHPDSHLALAVQPGADGMVRTLLPEGLVDEVITPGFLDRGGLGSRARGALALTARGWDLLVTGPDYSVIRESLFCGAPRRLGLDDGQPLQRHLNRRTPFDPLRHEAENQLVAVESIVGVPLSPARFPRLPRSPAAAVAAARRSVGLPAEGPYAVIHCGAQKPSRRWPVRQFAAFADRLLRSRPDLHVVLTGTDEERERVEALAGALDPAGGDRCRPCAGATDLRSLSALLCGAALVVCGDTGILHLTRALGTPLLAILGPENPFRWGPHPAGTGPAIAIRHAVPCAPCKRWECAARVCLRSVGVDEAVAAAELLLDGDCVPSTTVEPWVSSSEPHLYGVDVRGTPLGWADLHRKGLPVPVVRLVLPPDASGDASRVARDLGWPEDRTVTNGSIDPAAFAVAWVPDAAHWSGDRLGAEVGSLMRRPDLDIAGRCGRPREPGDPVPEAAAREGVTLRASALHTLQATASTTPVPPTQEGRRVVEASTALPRAELPD